MEHSAIKKMFREQYCLRDCDGINVKFLAKVNGIFEFLVEDYVTCNGHTTGKRSISNIGITDQIIKNLN